MERWHMDVRISVIIPVYNVEKYLAECLNSVLSQTIPFDEIILINDGSTDGSRKICYDFQLHNSQLQIIDQKNAGLSMARNVGMSFAKGDYIIFLDSDDILSSAMCETIKKVIIKNGFIDVLYYAADFIKQVPIAFPKNGYAIDDSMAGYVIEGFSALKKNFPEAYQMSACMSAYRRDFLKEKGIDFLKGILYEDRFFSLRVITEAKFVMYIQDKLYIRRFRADSIIMSPASKRKLQDVGFGHQMEWNYIRENKKWNTDKALMQYYALCSYYMAFQKDVSSEKETELQSKYALTFLESWLPHLMIDCMSLNELTFLLHALKTAGRNPCAFERLSKKKTDLIQYKKDIEMRLKEKCSDKLNSLPFKNKLQVGIYGLGRHTECMLNLYQLMIGDILSDIYFIVTEASDITIFWEKKVRCVNNIDPNTGCVVISSKMYREEMRENLIRAGFNSEKIMMLYTKNDAVDFVIISDVLEMN